MVSRRYPSALDVADKHTAPVWALEWVMRESPSGGEGVSSQVSPAHKYIPPPPNTHVNTRAPPSFTLLLC